MNNKTKNFCPACKGELRENTKFCPQCGKNLDSCKNCGAILISDDKFCHRCGAIRGSNQDQTEAAKQKSDEQKLEVMSSQVVYCNLKGCYHNERPQRKKCNECGSRLCYECAIEDLIGTRVVTISSTDTKYHHEYAYFCPSCYIGRISKSTYRIPVLGGGRPQRAAVPPKIFNPLSYGGKLLVAGNIILIAGAIWASIPLYGYRAPFEMVLFPLGVAVGLDIVLYSLARKTFRDFMKKKAYALNLLEEHKAKLQQA